MSDDLTLALVGLARLRSWRAMRSIAVRAVSLASFIFEFVRLRVTKPSFSQPGWLGVLSTGQPPGTAAASGPYPGCVAMPKTNARP